jgi:uncharacterized protein YkwD
VTRHLAALLLALLLTACNVPVAQQPVSPLEQPQQAVSPLPPPSTPRTLILATPRGYLPLVAGGWVLAEDGCSLNATAAAMLETIRTAAWQQRARVICDARLVAAAQAKSDEMARLVYASHISPLGVWPNQNVRAHGFPLPDWYPILGNSVESFAAGWGYSTPEIVLAAFSTSPSHWRHITASHAFFQAQECMAVGYSVTWDVGFRHHWIVLSAPCAG